MSERVWSVRSVVEYVYRSGSLGFGFGSAAAFQEGSRIHRLVQSRYGEEDRKELFLRAEVEEGDARYTLEGRCDGLLQPGADRELITIDEIKSTSGSLEEIEEDSHPVHWAQAYCYAWMYARAEGLEQIAVQLTYVQTMSEEERRFVRILTAEELESFVASVVQVYAPYARLQDDHLRLREVSIRELGFPFERYRRGQRELAAAVYKTHLDGCRLFAKAPTGTGKTISTIFPTVKAVGEGLLRRLVYLTARTTTRTAAEAAFVRMERQGLHLRSVTLTAKEKICFQEQVDCRKESCPYADGFYDRLNAALLDLLGEERRITRDKVEAYARKHRICPFEFSLEAAYTADVVIGDYNYIFDPRASLRRLWEEERKKTALLVDEAHNLVDRGREMFSAELGKDDFLALKRAFKSVDPAVHQTAAEVNAVFIKLRKKAHEAGSRFFVMPSPPDGLRESLEGFLQAAEGRMQRAPEEGEPRESLVDAFFQVRHFLRIGDEYDERYVTVVKEEYKGFRLRLSCLDPSLSLQRITEGFRSTIFFSATLAPLGYYRDILGGAEEDLRLALPSPFSPDQLDVLLLPFSTRFRDRERTKETLAARLDELLRVRPGRYLFFFPSYDYLLDVLERVREHQPPARILVQSGSMSEQEREDFLACFQEDTGERLVGFAVMGGIFGEAIDLAGDRLTGVAVIGVGLPQLGPERDLIRDYYSRTDRNGFDYAYVYPGMNKVLQAGGRLIRTEQDRGTLLLVDDRFQESPYRYLLPAEWQPIRALQAKEPIPPFAHLARCAPSHSQLKTVESGSPPLPIDAASQSHD
ncbi:ATP-dependent DNA helicase [Gorillibacterium timonense]|uniref:ATP-dependent DNA helicase n=1 Tax=Gorillibacterium timonense TaxID=1689269 RepID=UPI0009EB22DA|nr:ATP-dependent DNA helicase [Gorillibacterium timonense]